MGCGIYCIENMVNRKRYVGQGIDVEKRMNHNHRDALALYNAIKKYGKENFKRYILEYCELEQLEELETNYIKELHSHVSEWGYNISLGGKSPMTGRHHSDESNKKNRDAHLGEKNHFFEKHQSEEFCKKQSDIRLGTHPSDETRKRQSESHMGHSVSPEARKKMSESRSGENNYFFGKHPSDESREKNRIAHLGKRPSDKSRKKMSDARLGEKNPMFGKIGEKNPNFAKKYPDATSQYFGVSLYKQGKYTWWRVTFTLNGKHVTVGYYNSELEAALAYDEYIIENNINRPLNFSSVF